jgi:DNA invertase Pin-like site-specific DNA recombinase
VIYVRVSSDLQGAHGASLEAQESACRELARREDMRVVRVVRDVQTATDDALDRPRLQEALDLLDDGRAQAMIVWHVDRFSRNLRDAVGLVEDWFAAGSGRRLLSVTMEIDTGTPAGRLQLHIMLSVAQYEAEQTRARTRAAAAYFRKRGWYWGGEPPFGWRVGGDADDGRHVRLVEDKDEQRTIDLARRLRARGLSLRAVSLELGRRGARSRTGGAFSAVQVSRMVEDPAARAAG